MKILFVSHGLPPWARAGTENYTHYLSRALVKAGHAVGVFYRRNEPELPEYHRIDEIRDGVHLFGVNNTFRQVTTYESSYRNDTIDRIFEQVARSFGAQIVDIQHLNFLSTGIVDRALALGLPRMMRLHDYALLCPTGQFVKSDAAPCTKQEDDACVHCLGGQLTATGASRKAHGLASKLLKDNSAVMKTLGTLNRVRSAAFPPGRLGPAGAVRKREEHMVEIAGKIDHFLSPSAYLRDRLSGIIDRTKIEVSELGYNYDGCNTPRQPGSKIRFGFIGTVAPWKGLDTLLTAYGQVGPERCELHAHGRMVPVPDRPDYPARIEQLVADTGASYTGEYDQTEVYNLLARTDLLVVPSTSAENSPLTIHEARAAKVPVIGSRIGGIPEFVHHGKTGMLVTPGDPNDLAQAMLRFVEEPALVAEMKKGIVHPRLIEDDAKHHVELYNRFVK